MELNKAIEKILHFKDLKQDWNGYGAESLSKELIIKAIKLIKEFKPTPEVFPTARNSIQFEWEEIKDNPKHEIYFELEIFEDRIEMYGDSLFKDHLIEIGGE